MSRCPKSGMSINPKLIDSYRYCLSCGRRFNKDHVMPRSIPCLQYGFETSVDVCGECLMGQMVLEVVAGEKDMEDSEGYEREARGEARRWLMGRMKGENNEGGKGKEEREWEVLDKSTFETLLPNPQLKTLSSRSSTLRGVISDFLQSNCTMSDSVVMEKLEDEEEVEDFVPGTIAEDVTTAIKLLRTHSSKSTGSPLHLRYVLSYFLTLTKTPSGLSSLSLFWPQILQCYTSLFPVVGTMVGLKIKMLYEDFLLTVGSVSTKLCLELVWHVRANVNWGADLKIGDAQMVKMLVQVEAMFSGSIWGLGEKATEGKFHPSEHQQILIWDILSRARHKNLKGGVLQTLTKGGSGVMDERGRRFEGQLCIMKELGNTADECFSKEVPQRPEFLEASLERINTLVKPPNGSQGLVCENPVGKGGDRIIGLVEKEGKVFRSKARTPILLYMEIESSPPLPNPPLPTKSDDPNAIRSFRKIGVFDEEKSITEDQIRDLITTENTRRPSRRPSANPVKEDDGIKQLRELLNLRGGTAVAMSDSYLDAGQVDERLIGCGKISNSLGAAVKVYNEGKITKAELVHIAEKDEVFQTEKSKARGANVEFWTSETWKDKKARIRLSSPSAALPSWDLVALIVKANDDVRQETFVMQIIQLCGEIWKLENVNLTIKPYGIIGTGGSTGVIECVPNAMSIDALKQQRKEAGKDQSLLSWFESLEQPEKKKENFVRSLASYAIISHLLLLKDRHNGNILFDFDGNIVHIDFGFILGIAPGNQFSLETAPFKFTSEMVEVLGGKDGDLYYKFCDLFVRGFLALQPYGDKLCEIVNIIAEGSSFPCFMNKTKPEIDSIIHNMRNRFHSNANQKQTVACCLKLIRDSRDSSGTVNYDRYQYYSQGYLF